jgi:hypothetical protein
VQLRRIFAIEAIDFLLIAMHSPEYIIASREVKNNSMDQELYEQCLQNAEGDRQRARVMYVQRRIAEQKVNGEPDLDKREKWPMLLPLLTLYALGTIAVLLLVFGFLGLL